MNLGFTGTRKGMTCRQMVSASMIIATIKPDCVRHGCCVGADEEFDRFIRFHWQRIKGAEVSFHFHPPEVDGLAFFIEPRGIDVVHDTLPFLERNQRIVDGSDILLACPHESTEVQRSGTWSTVRYARRMKKPICTVYPDGSIGTAFIPDGSIAEFIDSILDMRS